MLQAPDSSPPASSGLAALAAQAIGLDPRSKAELHFDKCYPYLLSIGCFNGSPSLETFILEKYPQKSIKAYWLELVQLDMDKRKSPDMRRIVAWLTEYSNSKVDNLANRLERLWRFAKPIYSLFRNKRDGSAEKLRQRLEEELPMECPKVRPLSKLERKLLLEHTRTTVRSKRLRELADKTQSLEEEAQTYANAGDA